MNYNRVKSVFSGVSYVNTVYIRVRNPENSEPIYDTVWGDAEHVTIYHIGLGEEIQNKSKDLKDAVVIPVTNVTYYENEGIYVAAYTGQEIRPVEKVTLAGKILKKDTDYTVSYRDNLEEGEAKIVVTGMGEYTGTGQGSFTIRTTLEASAKSEMPGSITVTWKGIPNQNTYLIDLKKDGKSVDGYPVTTNQEASSGQTEFHYYINGLEEGTEYQPFIRASHSQAAYGEWTEIEKLYTHQVFKRIPETGYRFADSGLLEVGIDWGTAGVANQIETADGEEGVISLVDAENGKVLETGYGASSNGQFSYVQFNTAGDGKAPKAAPEDQLPYLKPDHEYYITISGAIFNKKGTGACYVIPEGDRRWHFRTAPVSYSVLYNAVQDIETPENYFKAFFGPGEWKALQKKDDGTGGICYGFCYAVWAFRYGYQGMKTIAGSADSLSQLYGISGETETEKDHIGNLIRYAEAAQAIQGCYSITKQKLVDHYNDYEGIVRISRNPNGEILGISFKNDKGKTKGHALVPLGIKKETSSSVVIAVYDCNYDRKQINAGSFIGELTFTKSGGKLEGWSYESGSHSFNSSDEGTYITYSVPGKMIDDLIARVQNGGAAKAPQGNLLYGDKGGRFKKDETEGVYYEVNPDTAGDSSEEGFAYWTDASSVTLNSENAAGRITFTGPYQSMTAEITSSVKVTMNLREETLTVVSENGKPQPFEVEITDYQDYKKDTAIVVKGTVSKKPVVLESDSNGVVISGEKVSGLTVTCRQTEGTDRKEMAVPLSASGTSVLLLPKAEEVKVYEDKDHNGSFESQIQTVTAQKLKAPVLSSVKNTSSKKATVKWKTVKGVDGYQIQYSLKSNFKGAKSTKVKGAKKSGAVVKKLAKKTWYFRIRSYRKAGKKTLYSAWSKVKKLKMKK